MGFGVWGQVRPTPSAEEIDENRREMFRRRFPNVAFHGDASPEKAKTGIQWLPFWESKRKF